jgi:GTP cyclohydrolase I
MVVVANIPVCSMCEHHMMPFIGHAHVGYIPDGRLLGVSKVARLVECYSRRLQLQERITSQVADAIMSHLAPKGVGVVIAAEHTCMTTRGVNRPGTRTITSATRGLFRDDEKTRAEFMSLIGVSP